MFGEQRSSGWNDVCVLMWSGLVGVDRFGRRRFWCLCVDVYMQVYMGLDRCAGIGVWAGVCVVRSQRKKERGREYTDHLFYCVGDSVGVSQ